MTLKEILGDSYTEEIAAKFKEVDIFEKGKSIPIEKHNTKLKEVGDQRDELKAQVDTLNKTLKSNNGELEKLKKSAGDNAELQKQIEEYQSKVAATQKEFGDTLKAKEGEWAAKELNNRKSYAMREKMLAEHADPKYLDMLMAQVDLSKIAEQDGSFVGLDDIVGGVKKNFDKLFGREKITGTVPGTGNIDPSGITKESIKIMTADQINKNWDAVQAAMKG